MEGKSISTHLLWAEAVLNKRFTWRRRWHPLIKPFTISAGVSFLFVSSLEHNTLSSGCSPLGCVCWAHSQTRFGEESELFTFFTLITLGPNMVFLLLTGPLRQDSRDAFPLFPSRPRGWFSSAPRKNFWHLRYLAHTPTLTLWMLSLQDVSIQVSDYPRTEFSFTQPTTTTTRTQNMHHPLNPRPSTLPNEKLSRKIPSRFVPEC